MLELVKFAEIVLRHQEEGQCWGGGVVRRFQKRFSLRLDHFLQHRYHGVSLRCAYYCVVWQSYFPRNWCILLLNSTWLGFFVCFFWCLRLYLLDILLRTACIFILQTFSLQMIMQLGGSCDAEVSGGTAKRRCDDSFMKQYSALSKDELIAALMVPSKLLFTRLAQTVSCVGCRRRLVGSKSRWFVLSLSLWIFCPKEESENMFI